MNRIVLAALAILAILAVIGCRAAETPAPVAAHGADEHGTDEHGTEEHGSAAGHEVRLDPAKVRAAGIEAQPLATASFHPHVVASGVIRPVAGRSVTLRAAASGRVASVAVDVGDRVAAGRLLATLESPELNEALARFRAAAARHEAARNASERAERLLAQEAISRAESESRRADAAVAMAEADAARQELVRLGLDPAAGAHAAFPVTTPLAGTVLSRSVSPGLLVARDAPLFEIADLARVWAVVDIYEKDLGQVRQAGVAEVRSDAWPGLTFEGRIALVEPTLEEASRTAHVRILLDNPEGRFRPGLFVSVALPVGGGDIEAAAVPAGAVQTVAGLPAVFVEVGPGRYALAPVEIGREAHGMIEITDGLEPGARVVTAGAFVLKSELLKATIGGHDH